MPRLKTYHGRRAVQCRLLRIRQQLHLCAADVGAAVLPHAGGGQRSRSLCRRPRPRAAAVGRRIAAALGGRVRIVDWQQANSSLVNAVEIERNVMFLILTLIILVAAFNIISGMIMMVKDKGRDIAILRTMGASRGMILRIFMLSGASIGVVGTLAGFALGVALHRRISRRSGSSCRICCTSSCSPPRSISSPAFRRSIDTGRGRRRRAHGAGAVVSRDTLPLLARRPARSGRGAALRMTDPRGIGCHRNRSPLSGARSCAACAKVFRQGGVELAVLNGVDLALRPGEIVALVGPSGAGKSTLLHVAGLLERPDGGAVLIEGRDCGGLSDEQRTLAAPPRARLCLPVPSSAAGVLGARKRHAAADDRRRAARRRPRARPQMLLDRVGLGRAPRPPPGAAVGRRAAARRDRARAGQRPENPAGRRADRQPRPRDRRQRHRRR